MRRALIGLLLAATSHAALAQSSAPPTMSTAGAAPPISVAPAPPAPSPGYSPPAMPAATYATPLSPASAPTPTPGAAPLDVALPPEPLVQATLDASPDVQAARDRLDAARAQAERLRVGEHETTFTATAAGRYESDYYSQPGRSPSATFPEGYVGAERAFRLPGKARLDRETGDLGVEAAKDEVDDARHKTALALADAWFTWVRASAEAELDRRSVTGAQDALAAMRRRVQLKDAAVLDEDRVAAALAVAQAKVQASQGEADSAMLSLHEGFPELPLPAHAPILPDPIAPPEPAEGWRAEIFARSHEIRIAELKAQEQRTIAERARLDEHPDPTFGVRGFNEQGNRETGAQLTFSIPFGGERRSAIAQGETAKASALQADAVKMQRDISTLAGQDVAQMRSALLAWSATRQAATAAAASAHLQQRAYALGAQGLSDTLLADGLVYQAVRAELDARVQAWTAVTRLRLDAHALWADGS